MPPGRLAKNIGPERTEAIRQQLGPGRRGRGLLPGAASLRALRASRPRARVEIGNELGLIDEDRFAFMPGSSISRFMRSR